MSAPVLIYDYQPWIGELAVQPMRCPACGASAAIWQYVEKKGGNVQRVVMCDGGEFEDDRLPMLLATCPLNLPPNSMYCQTARAAVEVWNRYGKAIVARRAENALPVGEPQ